MDRLLDRGASGPLHLRRPEIAELVVEALRAGERTFHRYELHAFVVMPNHVHLLVTPKVVATHWLAQFERIQSYIEENPVAAGLVAEAHAYPWSSAPSRLKGGCGQD